MAGKILAAGLVIGTSALIAAGAGNDARRTDACIEACAFSGNGAGHEAFDENVARIAVDAATPHADTAPLTKREWLSLYLLLSFKAGGKNIAL